MRNGPSHMTRRRAARGLRSEAGFSLFEVAVALAVLAIALPALTYAFAVGLTLDNDTSKRFQAYYLADAMINEISQRRFYQDSSHKGNGPESGEVTSGSYSRLKFNDVDDYNQFKLSWGKVSPPKNEDGTDMTNLSEFSQYVEVVNIPAPGVSTFARTLTPQSDGSTDFKAVTVTIGWQNNQKSVQVIKVFARTP